MRFADVKIVINHLQVIVASLYAVEDRIPPNPSCFELYGVDVMIDSNFRPWLIEANASPSLGAATPLDKRIKVKLLKDTLKSLKPA